ncbi:MAG: cytochrome P450, partial [Chloroflexota bacterium]
MISTVTLQEEFQALFAGRADLVADPYALYGRLRNENPVYPIGPQYVLTRYSDIAAVLRDPRFSSNGNKGSRRGAALAALTEPAASQLREIFALTGLWMLFSDAPDHTRRRTLANRAFTARRVDGMRQRIQRLVDELLDAVAGTGAMDVIADLAYPLPVIVIAELLGVPVEDRGLIKGWSNEMALFFGANFRNVAEMHRAMSEFRVYLRDLVAQRRTAPGDDLLTALVQATDEGDRLSEEELLGLCMLLLFAGHETTTNLIGNGMLALLRHPAQLALLRHEPSLIGSAVEELLRYDSPVQGTPRIVTKPMTLGRTAVQPGQTLLLFYGAANRDPERFSEPDRLDITRRDTKHLAFAHGAHFCLGAALARMEGQIALDALTRLAPDLHLAGGAVEWRPNALMRGLK